MCLGFALLQKGFKEAYKEGCIKYTSTHPYMSHTDAHDIHIHDTQIQHKLKTFIKYKRETKVGRQDEDRNEKGNMSGIQIWF